MKALSSKIKNYRNQVDDESYRIDGLLDLIRQAIEVMKGLSLGIFTANAVLNAATNFVNGINIFNKKNMQDQGRVKGIDLTKFESWLDEFMRTSIAENASYISTIRDEYFPKIESIIYQGVKNGTSEKRNAGSVGTAHWHVGELGEIHFTRSDRIHSWPDGRWAA